MVSSLASSPSISLAVPAGAALELYLLAKVEVEELILQRFLAFLAKIETRVGEGAIFVLPAAQQSQLS